MLSKLMQLLIIVLMRSATFVKKVKYAPTQAQFKVYIIDEVHMLSAGAF
jgi:hypothetical protein